VAINGRHTMMVEAAGTYSFSGLLNDTSHSTTAFREAFDKLTQHL